MHDAVRAIIVIFLVSISLFIGCSTNKKTDMPCAIIIVGKVELVRKGEVAQLAQGQYLQVGDTVRVDKNAKVKLELSRGATWYLNKGTVLAIGEPVALSGENRRIPVSLPTGQLHIVKREEGSEEYLVQTTKWAIRVTAADITICADDGDRLCGVSLLCGFATFTPSGGTATVIPTCNMLLSKDETIGELQPLTTSDIETIKGWVGSTIVEEALKISDCAIPELVAINEPPRWQDLPRETASLHETMVDTIKAEDPEQTKVIYSITNAPEGMTLDENYGILRYKASKVGTFPFVLIATDANEKACTTKVALTVTRGLSVRLWSPYKVEPGKPFTISVATQGAAKNSLRYRFDTNGDGKFNMPSKGRYSRRARVGNCVFNREGIFTLKVEVAHTDKMGVVSARRRIVVNAPPVAVLQLTPSDVALIETPVEFDVSASSDRRNGTTPLKVRFDVDGDGTWDLPKGNEFLTVSKVTYAWEKAGSYTVRAQLTDKDGAYSIATSKIIISEGITGGKIVVADTVNVGDSILMTCTHKKSEFPIKEYAWSFNGDTIYEKITKASRVKTLYTKAGMVSVRCRVINEKGQQAMISKLITVINSPSEVDAGGPYKIGVNATVILKGSGKDKDSRITAYLWDVDGDGTTDYSSEKEASVTHVYKKSGIYTAYFTIKTDDGKKSTDSARVEVINKPPRATAGEDILSKKGRKIKLTGSGEDEDGTISLYEWDFDGDGAVDWSSKENGTVEHEFTSYGSAIFRVHDSDGAIATDTVQIIICPKDMETIQSGKFCIDTYEYPNKRNSTPQVNVTYEQAKQICTGLGKRLCTSEEWKMACSDGKKRYNYPYGKDFNENRCNTLGNARIKNSISSSGQFFECENSAGVFDMSGNVAEWTLSKGAATVFGGSWQNGKQGSTCESTMQLEKGKKYFYVGFRCCK